MNCGNEYLKSTIQITLAIEIIKHTYEIPRARITVFNYNTQFENTSISFTNIHSNQVCKDTISNVRGLESNTDQSKDTVNIGQDFDEVVNYLDF